MRVRIADQDHWGVESRQSTIATDARTCSADAGPRCNWFCILDSRDEPTLRRPPALRPRRVIIRGFESAWESWGRT